MSANFLSKFSSLSQLQLSVQDSWCSTFFYLYKDNTNSFSFYSETHFSWRKKPLFQISNCSKSEDNFDWASTLFWKIDWKVNLFWWCTWTAINFGWFCLWTWKEKDEANLADRCWYCCCPCSFHSNLYSLETLYMVFPDRLPWMIHKLSSA